MGTFTFRSIHLSTQVTINLLIHYNSLELNFSIFCCHFHLHFEIKSTKDHVKMIMLMMQNIILFIINYYTIKSQMARMA